MPIPTVSVIMPVRDGAPFLMGAIHSILCQTLSELELVVVDDGSIDDTWEQLTAVRDERLVLLRQPRSGIVAALNRAIGVSRARYLARMDADDVALPHRLERQVSYLDSHPEVAVVGSWVERIGGKGKERDTASPAAERRALRSQLVRHNLLVHSSTMIRRSALDQVGLYRPEFEGAEDYDLWLRIIHRWDISILPEVLLQYRVHSGSATNSRQRLMLRKAIRARWQAVRRGTYSSLDLIWLAGPLLALCLPPSLSLSLRQRLRRLMPGS